MRVATDWFSDPERIHGEALGLRWLAGLTPPGAITPIVFEDHEKHLLAMEAVPRPHENWKTMLPERSVGEGSSGAVRMAPGSDPSRGLRAPRVGGARLRRSLLLRVAQAGAVLRLFRRASCGSLRIPPRTYRGNSLPTRHAGARRLQSQERPRPRRKACAARPRSHLLLRRAGLRPGLLPYPLPPIGAHPTFRSSRSRGGRCAPLCLSSSRSCGIEGSRRSRRHAASSDDYATYQDVRWDP